MKNIYTASKIAVEDGYGWHDVKYTAFSDGVIVTDFDSEREGKFWIFGGVVKSYMLVGALQNIKVTDPITIAIEREIDPGYKILILLNHDRAALLDLLSGLPAYEQLQNKCNVDLARIVYSWYGPLLLRKLKLIQGVKGGIWPNRFNNEATSRFAKALGLPVGYLRPVAKRSAEEVVEGPQVLPELHPFQQTVVDQLLSLIRSDANGRRAVVNMPTGSGKTRVTVEAIVEAVLKPSNGNRVVLWIAQTDELCEQAVQSIVLVWKCKGNPSEQLRIVRLWGGATKHLSRLDQEPMVIVASINTMSARLTRRDLSPIKQCDCVVFDECHHSVANSYRDVIRFLEEPEYLSENTSSKKAIIGLSATPYRADEEGTSNLARRYNHRMYPERQIGLEGMLVRNGVLAKVNFEELISKAELTLEETEDLNRVIDTNNEVLIANWLDRVNIRLANQGERNELIVDLIKEADERSVLFFANSTHHAEEIAMRLLLKRVEAASIDQTTPFAIRRHNIERFLSGSLRVLCNYNVLSTGFDAPKTDLIIISRNVYSRTRYMQMIGRGLRGPRNGGTEVCRVVTVLDNLGRFNDRHPYHYYAAYYKNLTYE